MEWCLLNARQQFDSDFTEIRQFPSRMAKNYVSFMEGLEPATRWTFTQGLIFRGLMSDRYQSEHSKLWDEFIAFAMKDYSIIPPPGSRPKRPRGPRLIKLMKASWNTEQFGDFTWEQKTEFRTELMDRGWCLQTSVVFDRSLLRDFKIVGPQGLVQLDGNNTLSWLGLGASEWDDACRESEDEIVEQVIQLQSKYAKAFLHHFSRQDE